MHTIFKYPLTIEGCQLIKVPNDAKFLHVDVQESTANRGLGTLCIWAEVDADKEPVEYVVYIVGTGHEMHEYVKEAHYVGSAMMGGGRLVWHVYIGRKQ